ncbi:ANTAR domain-containing protein [Geodermatophilus sp. YIM 151500]|uniref:ANTAR domain-containing protein n=1 Tax=Geodermatophilus sp. YIM 151500 TaxID=2984531 RepID=UPI0021E35A05|nr:ANTAR domain-containing protein [Geodermatophilus sp. YIM 151500]MCV2491550.1 ANTAR domain-containing protein [Geodermatophilus sp. YIM 151500]
MTGAAGAGEVDPVGTGRTRPGRSAELLSALGELEVAQEELRVAEEEITAQRAELDVLLARQAAERGWRERLTDLLAVGVLVTDAQGGVLEANAAACDLIGIRPVHLVGKPLPVFVRPDERTALRSSLRRLVHGAAEERVRVTLAPRRGAPLPVELVGMHVEGGVRWVVVPDRAAPARPDGVTTEGPPSTARTPAAASPPEPPVGEAEAVATAFARLCLLPLDSSDPQRLLGRLAAVVTAAIPGADASGVSLGSPRAPERLASDDALAQQFDGLQLQAGEGPCVDAYEQRSVVVGDDLPGDPRWPGLARADPHTAGVRSVLALPIPVQDRHVGVLNVYARGRDVFSAHAVRIGELVVVAVGAVFEAVEERRSLQELSRHLNRALESRAVIDQAKGMVMARHGGTADAAFARLVAYSSRHNVKLRDVAALLVRGEATDALLRQL